MIAFIGGENAPLLIALLQVLGIGILRFGNLRREHTRTGGGAEQEAADPSHNIRKSGKAARYTQRARAVEHADYCSRAPHRARDARGGTADSSGRTRGGLVERVRAAWAD